MNFKEQNIAKRNVIASALGCVAISLSLFLAACGDDSSSNSGDDVRLIESIEDAGECTDANANEMVKIKATNVDGDTVFLFFICEDKEWVSDIGGLSRKVLKPSAVIRDSIKDERDGRTYRTSKVGEQTWIVENLKYEMEGSLCYENKKDNCKKYGRLYSMDAAKKACPSGWHPATNGEWKTMLETLGNVFLHSSSTGDVNTFQASYKDDSMKDQYGFNIVASGYGLDPEYAAQSNQAQFGNFPRGIYIWAPTDSELKNDVAKWHQVRIDTKKNLAQVFVAGKEMFLSVVCAKD